MYKVQAVPTRARFHTGLVFYRYSASEEQVVLVKMDKKHTGVENFKQICQKVEAFGQCCRVDEKD